MGKFAITSAAAAAATALSLGQASAAVIDFAAEALAGGERGLADGAALNTAALGGLNLQFTAGIGGAGSDFPYFNGSADFRLPGLGVCTRLNAQKACAPSGDDNISRNEFVRIAFLDGPFNVRRLSFNGQNADVDGTAGLVQITTSLNAAVSVATLTFAEANVFNFGQANWIEFAFVDTEFVVERISDVPLPGALPLLLSGIVGISFAFRRSRA